MPCAAPPPVLPASPLTRPPTRTAQRAGACLGLQGEQGQEAQGGAAEAGQARGAAGHARRAGRQQTYHGSSRRIMTPPCALCVPAVSLSRVGRMEWCHKHHTHTDTRRQSSSQHHSSLDSCLCTDRHTRHRRASTLERRAVVVESSHVRRPSRRPSPPTPEPRPRPTCASALPPPRGVGRGRPPSASPLARPPPRDRSPRGPRRGRRAVPPGAGCTYYFTFAR